MDRVTGIGGVFFRADNPDTLHEWYEKHLGLKREPGGPVIFRWRQHQDTDVVGTTIWSLFPKDTSYFGSSDTGFMLNYRVKDLDKLLEVLREEGVEIDPKQENSEYGRFAWITDPEGNRIELWEPPPGR